MYWYIETKWEESDEKWHKMLCHNYFPCIARASVLCIHLRIYRLNLLLIFAARNIFEMIYDFRFLNVPNTNWIINRTDRI